MKVEDKRIDSSSKRLVIGQHNFLKLKTQNWNFHIAEFYFWYTDDCVF